MLLDDGSSAGREPDRDTGARGRARWLAPEGRQMEVMSILWRLGSATVAQMQAELNDTYEPEIAYNTVLTYLRALRRRGWVQVEPAGRAHRYFPAVSLDYARWLEIGRITDLLYGGTRQELLVTLVSDRNTHPSALVHVRLALDERLRSQAGGRR